MVSPISSMCVYIHICSKVGMCFADTLADVMKWLFLQNPLYEYDRFQSKRKQKQMSKC